MANNQADENYIVRIITETKGSLEDLKRWREEVDAAKDKMKELKKESGASLDDVKRAFLEGAEGAGVFSDDMKRVKRVTTQAVKEMKQETQGLGEVFKIAFGVSLGQIATRAVRDFVREIREGIQRSIEFSGEVARLNVNLRAFQRTGGDIQSTDLIAFIDRLSEKYRVFSERDIVNATQQSLNYARQLDLTAKQTEDFIDLAAQQAIVMGTDL
ncbi:hypothetical protein GF373_17350, partial [bacterium]|nr:hypothetical protein [bacterium]